MSIRIEFITRARIVILGLTLFCVLILYKLVSIQFIYGEKWRGKSDNLHLSVRKIKATRGNIFSDDGSLLATSSPKYRLAMDPTVSKITVEREKIFNDGIEELSQRLHRFYAQKAKSNKRVRNRSAGSYLRLIKNAREANKRYVSINSTKINYAEKKAMEKWPIFKAGRMKGGVLFEKEETRFRPFTSLAFRTIGYTTADDSTGEVRGRKGLEYSFNEYLAGKTGAQLHSKMSGGVWKPVTEDYVVTPEEGHDIHTTLDVNIQDFAESALKRAVAENKASNGCAIVMDVKTGDIKALVNVDQKIRNGDTTYSEVYNNAVAKRYEPGSTIKLASVIALLEENSSLTLDTKVETDNGVYNFYDAVMRDSRVGGYGTISLLDVFKKSSNVGIAKLVEKNFYHSRAMQQKFIAYLRQCKLTEPMGFQLKGEAVPFVKTPDDDSWSGISLPWISIGYESLISPLQMLGFYNAIANDGYYVKPRIVSTISDDGKVIKEFRIEKDEKRICSEKTLEKVKIMLKSVVEKGGTADNIRSSQYAISGKTGTKKNIKEGKYVKEYYATFAGFFPSENPKYSIMIAIDHPTQGKFYGGSVAAPVFKEIADKIYTNDLALHKNLDLEFERKPGVFPVIQAGYYKDLETICEELKLSYRGSTDKEWVRAQRNDELKRVQWKDLDLKYEKVPDVSGLTIRDALSLLEMKGLRVSFSGRGRVVSQSQEPGTNLLVGSKIKLILE